MKKAIASVLVLVVCLSVPRLSQAQQDPQFTQYMFNGLLLNPAYAGSKGFTSLSGSHRSQWTGLEGAPVSQTLSVDGNLNRKLAGGFIITNDRLGAQRFTEVSFNSAVRISLSPTTRVAVGISLGATQQTLDGTKLDPAERDDMAIPMNIERAVKPSARVGAYLYSNRFYTGLSLGNVVFFQDGLPTDPKPHLFLTSGGVFDISRKMKFRPSILLKEDFNGPAALDLNTFLLFNEQIWLGTSFRTTLNIFNNRSFATNTRLGNALAVLLELHPSPLMRIGYSYDFSLNKLRSYSSHEISLGYNFLKKKYGRMLTPRYF
ncbi:PorP/SprF family type IX secretion system membrane protein [Rufibacter latericius]|uniref:Type IX secretion system membrane protein PorP/SprF n=1 Tax=Rufibacter latericius TaxID=2487040 RepID=A0A3M9MD96_9BACT|nr:type IX secretion system membrane protein PorP/SprF [Rufibacter latericius]RNI23541.1 type IX secretion system membrane protein PorP/SprF [Rufibacter latericius]